MLKIAGMIIFASSVFLPLQSVAEAGSGFFNIAHMTNTVQAIDWAIDSGSNAVEVDLRFDDSADPVRFFHGFPCDCSCDLFGDAEVCKHLGSDPCAATTSAEKLLNHIAQKPQLALLVIDSKVSGYGELRTAGENVVRYLDEKLFAKGFQGSVLISVAYADSMAYLISASEKAASSINSSRYHFSIDQNGDDAAQTISLLISQLPASKNRIYGTGIHTCAIFDDYYETVKLASINQRNGVVGGVYIWTVDDPASMKKYIDHGVSGIMTNNPAKLRTLLARDGIRLFSPGERLPAATSDDVIRDLN